MKRHSLSKENKFIIVLLCVAVLTGALLWFSIIDERRVNYGVGKAISQQEYEVYSDLFDRLYKLKPTNIVVISDTTSIQDIPSLSYVERKLSVAQTAMRNFEAKNKHQWPVEQSFKCQNKCVLLSSEQSEEIFRDKKGWQRFRIRFPNSSGLVTLSRVGFSGSLQEAVVYLTQTRDYLFGSSVFYRLRYRQGHWQLDGELVVGVS